MEKITFVDSFLALPFAVYKVKFLNVATSAPVEVHLSFPSFTMVTIDRKLNTFSFYSPKMFDDLKQDFLIFENECITNEKSIG